MNAHASARDGWLSRALGTLESSAPVVAVELVGSLRRRESDDWSDVDLLVFVDGDPLHAIDAVPQELGELAVRLDAPHNTRADGHSFGAVFLVDGQPLATDWYMS